MENNNFNFLPLYIILALTALILILSGIFLPQFFEMIQVKIDDIFLKILQLSFIISGIIDLGLLIYAKKKLS